MQRMDHSTNTLLSSNIEHLLCQLKSNIPFLCQALWGYLTVLIIRTHVNYKDWWVWSPAILMKQERNRKGFLLVWVDWRSPCCWDNWWLWNKWFVMMCHCWCFSQHSQHCAARRMTPLLFMRIPNDYAGGWGQQQKRFLLVWVGWRSHAVYPSRSRNNMSVMLMASTHQKPSNFWRTKQ
jgi:hypothetical protein